MIVSASKELWLARLKDGIFCSILVFWECDRKKEPYRSVKWNIDYDMYENTTFHGYEVESKVKIES